MESQQGTNESKTKKNEMYLERKKEQRERYLKQMKGREKLRCLGKG